MLLSSTAVHRGTKQSASLISFTDAAVTIALIGSRVEGRGNDMVGTLLHSAPLSGKRILLLERDDRLYCMLKHALDDAGCETFGSLAPLSDAPAIVPAHIDAALVDVNCLGSSLSILARQLEARNIPTLVIAAKAGDDLPMSLRSSKQLSKPFTEEELVIGMLEAINRFE